MLCYYDNMVVVVGQHCNSSLRVSMERIVPVLFWLLVGAQSASPTRKIEEAPFLHRLNGDANDLGQKLMDYLTVKKIRKPS